MTSSPATPISVSIALPVSDGWDRTFRCLLSIVQSSTGVRRETIVVDNGTSDDTRTALPHLDGITAIRNERDQGFGRACNQALQAAKGDVLLVLDRDAVVEQGWLLSILRPFEDASVAAVVPVPGAGLDGAFLAIRASELRAAGGWDEARPDAADALLGSFVAQGRRVEAVAVPAMRLAPAEAAPAAAQRPRLSVVVPACDAAATLGPCLEGIQRNLRDDDEIVVADGGSRDETLRSAYAFASLHPRQVRVVSARSAGPAEAAREGLQAASNDVALLLHPSVAAPDGFVDGILDLLARNPGTQALGIEVPRAGVCVAGPSALLRGLDARTFFQADGVALAEAMGRAGARLAFVPAGP